MIQSMVARRPQWTTVMGSGLVLVGLVLFMVVFLTLLPILTNPVGAYDKWFPIEDEVAAPVASTPPQEGPVAGFTWEAVAVETVDPAVYRVRFAANVAPAAAAIASWDWDFGDGAGDSGPGVIHDYTAYGSYAVTLIVIDTTGKADSVTGEIAVPGLAATTGATGQINDYLNLDIDASIQDAVGSVGAEIRSSIDGAVGSIGASARGAVVVFLFILAAIASTIVAWRVARIGVMILNGSGQTPPTPTPPPYFDDYESRRQLEVV